MKVILRTDDLKRLVKATAKFISKDENRLLLQYIRLEFNSTDKTVKAVALDGYRIAIENASCEDIDESFTAYIKPYLPVGANAPYSRIEMSGENCLINIDGRIVGYQQPKGNPFDYEKFLKELEEQSVSFKVAVNPQYLMDTLSSAKASCGYKKEVLVIEYRGGVQPLLLRTENGKRIVLPCRLNED